MNLLTVAKKALGKGSPINLKILLNDATLMQRFADDIISEYQAAKASGRGKVVCILPVGPVTPNVPASLLQNHPDVLFAITNYVAEIPEPQLS